MTIQTVKLSQLTLSPLNVRKVAPQQIEQLAADIAAHGQLQNLIVYAEGKGFEVAAGGRRFRALKLLAKAKTIPASHPVAVDVRTKAEAIELSLAENAQREAMHSADAVAAYGALRDQGTTAEDIAARFGVAVSYVTKVLRLSALHPEILARFAKDEIGMAEAQALTLTDDTERQLVALQAGLSAAGIKRFLTEEKLKADSSLVQFVGIDAYADAGGTITADMFAEEGQGYADNPALIERLAMQKLGVIEAVSRADGWQDVRVSLSRPDDYYSFSGMAPEGRREPSEEEALTIADQEAAIAERMAELEGDYWGDDRLNKLRSVMRALERELTFFTGEQMAEGAMILFVGHNGEAELCAVQGKNRKAKSAGEAPAKPDYPASMTESLTKIKTLAVQEAVANDPGLALDILIDALAGQIAKQQPCYAHPLTFRVERFNCSVNPDLLDGSSINSVTEWQDDNFAAVPDEGRFEAIRAMDADDKGRLLAVMVAGMLNGVEIPGMARGARHDCFERIALASGVDMNAKWSAPEAFFAKLPKPTMLKALTEAVSADAAANCAKMKKGELAAACAGRIAGRGWLPPALRITEPREEIAEQPMDEGEVSQVA